MIISLSGVKHGHCFFFVINFLGLCSRAVCGMGCVVIHWKIKMFSQQSLSVNENSLPDSVINK